jgi:hypothetical protein
MTVGGGDSPEPRLFEVTWFKNYGYREIVPVRLTADVTVGDKLFSG